MTPWIIWSVVSLLALIGFFFWNFQKFLHSSSDSKKDFPGDDYDYVIRNLSLVILPLVIALPFTVGLCIQVERELAFEALNHELTSG